MKFFNTLGLWLVAAAVGLLSSCSERVDYLSAVPAESAVVMKMNVGSLLDKSEVMESRLVQNNLNEALNTLSDDTKRVVEEAIENPASTGIDFRRPVVIAMENVQRPQGMLLFAVNDAAKLTDFLRTLIADDEIDLQLELGEANGGIRTLTDKRGSVVGAYDATRLVLSYAGRDNDATKYLSLPKKEQAFGLDGFKAFARAEQDIAIYYNYGRLMASNPYLTMMLDRESPLLDMTALFTTNFEAGRVAFGTEVFGNSELRKLNDRMTIKPTGKYLRYVPTDSYLVINSGVRNFSTLTETFAPNIRQVIEQGLQSLNADLTLLDKIEGDITFAVLPISRGENNALQFFAAVECSDRQPFDLLAENLVGNMATRVADDTYGCKINRYNEGYDYYILYREGTVFFTPSDLYAQCFAGDKPVALTDNFTKNPLADALNGKGGMVVDFRAITREVAADYADFVGTGGVTFLSLLKDLTLVQAAGDMAAEGSLDFIDSKTNALKQLTDAALKLIGDSEL